MRHSLSGPVFSYKLRYIVGFWLVEMAISISTNQKPTIYRILYEYTPPDIITIKALYSHTIFEFNNTPEAPVGAYHNAGD